VSSKVTGLLADLSRGDRRALSKLLSLATEDQCVEEMRSALGNNDRRTRAIAVTGSGGVGKSTLIGRLVEHIRTHGETVAVLACDPESSLTGGALLGDRVRMAPPPMSRPVDDGVFIRSLATPSGQQGVAPRIDLMVKLFANFGFQNVIIETVGAGQGDVAVRQYADVVVVLVQPEAGDELQWAKAGILEIADVVVVHKSDLPGAESVASALRDDLHTSEKAPPIVLVSSSKRRGLGELWEAIRKAIAF
jgi:LAO/AO transport system kinase